MSKPITAKYRHVYQKMINHPGDLRPADIERLKELDPWLGKSAVKAWEAAHRRADYLRKRRPGVVRLQD